MKTAQLKQFIRSNGFAWPGCYPMFALMADGDVIDARSASENYKLILDATVHPKTNPMWEVIAIDVHWEGKPLICANSGRLIESAYGVPE